VRTTIGRRSRVRGRPSRVIDHVRVEGEVERLRDIVAERDADQAASVVSQSGDGSGVTPIGVVDQVRLALAVGRVVDENRLARPERLRGRARTSSRTGRRSSSPRIAFRSPSVFAPLSAFVPPSVVRPLSAFDCGPAWWPVIRDPHGDGDVIAVLEGEFLPEFSGQ